jgi:chromosome segregation ATPase
LEVENFRGILSASIPFGPGLNVLHGPNELGKSTLTEAIRAALLVPTRSKEGQSYISWAGAAPARVVLTFESGDVLWRVNKMFGSPYRSVLERSERTDVARFHEVAHGNDVEGKVRELLCWGVAPPGGKGAPVKPTSYLVTALLGRQGEVQSILDASLAEDRDGTGKELITKALGALGKDPLVARIVDRLSQRIEEIFTPNGKFKRTADSPLVKLQEHLRQREEQLRKLREADTAGKAIENTVVTLQAERLQLLEERQSAETNLAAAKGQEDRRVKRATLQDVVSECRKELDKADVLASELAALQERLTSREAGREQRRAEKESAGSASAATQRLAQVASEAVVRATEVSVQSARLGEAGQQQRRAELEGKKASLDARLRDLDAAERAMADGSELERGLESAKASAAAASAAVTDAEHALECARVSAKLIDLTERQAHADRLVATFEQIQLREAAALERLRAAEVAQADAASRRDRRETETNDPEVKRVEADLGLLRAVDLRMRIQSLRDFVRELEGRETLAREYRERAATRRIRASQVEQELARRVLPTEEQIASWRALEAEVDAASVASVPAEPSPVVPVVAGTVAGLVAILVAKFPMAFSATVAVTGGIVIGALVALAVWALSRGNAHQASEEHHRRQRRSERWALEVEPSLRAAHLPNLAAYDAALTDVAHLRGEVQRLRLDADEDDRQAALANQAATTLEGRRAELSQLEREESPSDAAGLNARLQEFSGDLPALVLRIDEAQKHLENLTSKQRQGAEQAVDDASARTKECQADYDALVREAARASAESEVARRGIDPTTIVEIRARLDTLGGTDALPAVSLEAAAGQLERCSASAAEASTRVAVVQAKLEAARSRADQCISALGGNPEDARRDVERDHADVELQLQTMQSLPQAATLSADNALTDAKQKQAEVELTLDVHRRALETATVALSEADSAVTNVTTEIASKQGELKAIDRSALDAKMAAMVDDPVFHLHENEVDGGGLGAAHDVLEGVRRRLEQCDSRLNAAKGQLHLVAGHVGAERLAQQEEAVSFAREGVLDRERAELAAQRLFNEIQAVEAERASNLGRTLAEPITTTFRALTGGRYDHIEFDPDLKSSGIRTQGAPRQASELSVGTREQLATLIRLAIAAHLQTALVLDDQLVHSDSGRLAWFRDRLRSSAAERYHQIIVFTCRPEDYVGTGGREGDLVSSVDLGTQISR